MIYIDTDFINKNGNIIDNIQDIIKQNNIMLLKFDFEDSKYNEYFHNIPYKTINITDNDIIEFYDISELPTILIYKNKNLLDSIEGYYSKSVLTKKILEILN